MNETEMLKILPYSLETKQKEGLLLSVLKELTQYHIENCTEYKSMMLANHFQKNSITSLKDIPFLPVRLFKELELKSILDSEVFKVITSSGTTGQKVSKIYLDKQTAANQQKVLVKIVSETLGTSRMPMLIIDCPSVIKNRSLFSARGAGILGFSIFGKDKTYALDDEMNLDVEAINMFLKRHEGEQVFIFGFTFMIWKHFYKNLEYLYDKGVRLDLHNAVMIHGGGWKKLIQEAVTSDEFGKQLKCVCGIDSIHDYYGMVEQTGCIYIECECGHLHASIFSDIIIRNPLDFSVCANGEVGIVQVLSVLPRSYPGHSILTEDKGVILGEDDCPCGRKGKYFKITGRIQNAEIRGCSDTYASNFQ